jgi:hypothetical protein
MERDAGAREGAPQVNVTSLDLAGVAFARRCHIEAVMRGYRVPLMFGGARSTLDFTGLVGGPDHITVNWSSVGEILDLDPDVTETITDQVPSAALTDLGRFVEFRQAMEPEGLTPAAFASFGPVQHFRDRFRAGWSEVARAVAAARATLVA